MSKYAEQIARIDERTKRIAPIEKKIDKINDRIDDHGIRLTVLEERQKPLTVIATSISTGISSGVAFVVAWLVGSQK